MVLLDLKELDLIGYLPKIILGNFNIHLDILPNGN